MEFKKGYFRLSVLVMVALMLSISAPVSGDVLAPTDVIPNPGANNLDNFGYSVVDGADLDGDSTTDFIMCGFYWGSSGQNKQGDCRAFSGADLTELFEFGNPTPQSFNVNAAFLNVDNDPSGYIDVIMGGDLKDNGKTPAVGEAYVFFLGLDRKNNLGVTGYQTIESPVQAAGIRFAHSVAVFDYGSDSRVVFGAPGAGKAYVYRLENDQLVLHDEIPSPGAPGDEFGYAMAAVGNYLVVGAPGNTVGSVYVYDTLSGFNQVDSRVGTWAGFGKTVTALGDVDSNGTEDIAIGTNDGKSTPVGTMEVFDIADLNGAALLTLSGNRITSVGNWDCDEYLDLLVGSSSFDQPAQGYLTGPLAIVSGADGSVLDTLDNGSNDSTDGFGYAFDVGGDLDVDGQPDILAGAPGAVDGRGQAYAFAGRPEQVDSDQDGVPDGCDTCQGHPDGEDTDGDGLSWPCDPCPDDPADGCLDDLTVTIDVDAGAHILEPGIEVPATTTLTNEPAGSAGNIQVVGPTCPGLSYRFYVCDDPLKTTLAPLYLMGASLGPGSVIQLDTGDSASATCNILDYLHPETIAAITSEGAAVNLCGEVCYSSYGPFECIDEDAAGNPVPCFPNFWQGGTFCDEFTVGLVKPLIVPMEVKPSPDFDPTTIPTINLGLNGNVPLVILGSAVLDVRQVDPLSVYLESGSFLRGTNGGDQYSYDDSNGDGLEDLVLHMDIEAYIPGDQVTVRLYGRTHPPESLYIIGYDDVRILDK